MKNTLGDLNNYLFEQLERINDDSLTPDEVEMQMKKTQTIVNVSNAIIGNAKLGLEATKIMCEYGRSENPADYIPKLITNGKED